jgi:hypothetical protein
MITIRQWKVHPNEYTHLISTFRFQFAGSDPESQRGPGTEIMAEQVVWPDSSLGCPQEGMLYAQVLTPGYLIRLAFGKHEFEYHASKRTSIFYCENPTSPAPGTLAGI